MAPATTKGVGEAGDKSATKVPEEGEVKDETLAKVLAEEENDATPAKPHRHSIYEVTSIPALLSKKVPLKERVFAFRKLKHADNIYIQQYFDDDIYDTSGFNMSNVYTVSVPNRFSFHPNEQDILFYIGEKISCEASWLKTSGRVIHFRVLTPEGTPACIISRGCSPCSCFSNIFPCCANTQFYVSLPDGRYFGRVVKCFNFFRPKFAVYDAENRKVFVVNGLSCGNCCPIWLISDAVMKISRIHTSSEKTMLADEPVDFIDKSCSPICEQTSYTLKIGDYMGCKQKMLLISLIVIIDFLHYRRCGTICHLLIWTLWLMVVFGTCGMLFYCTAVCSCFQSMSALQSCFAIYNPTVNNVDYDYP